MVDVIIIAHNLVQWNIKKTKNKKQITKNKKERKRKFRSSTAI
jgi:hypothetical protein